MRTVISQPVVKQCPYKEETDFGTLTITFDGPAPELHALAAIIDALAFGPVSHEDFTQVIAESIADVALGATVLTSWQTGPWRVEVTQVVA